MNDRSYARFIAKVDISQGERGCHLWIGARNRSGYGLVHTREGQRMAHRLAWEHVNGPIPEGAMIRHLCGTSLCVNPSHLAPGSAWDNAQDAKRHGSYTRGARHWASKLTEEDVRRVFEMRQAGMTYSDIANRMNVAYTTVHSIVTGKTWTEVPRPDGLPKRVPPPPIPADIIEMARRMRDDEGASWKSIEIACGYTRLALANYLPRRTGYNPNPAILSPAEADEAVKLRSEGLSWTKMTRHFGGRISRIGLYQAWRGRFIWWVEAEERVALHPLRPERESSEARPPNFSRDYVRGSSHHNAKLTEDQIWSIRGRRLAGLSWAQIAGEMGIARTTVSRAAKGETWGHLDQVSSLPSMVVGRRKRSG